MVTTWELSYKLLENEKVTKLLEAIGVEESIPFEWENSETVLIYRKMDDPLDCGNYLGIKLSEHQLKVLECILDQRLRKIINIDSMQFGFSTAKGTINSVFIARQVQEKFMEKRDLYFTFVELGKAYDRVPRELVYGCLRKRNVPESLVRLVRVTYQNTKMVVRTVHGQTEPFDIMVG